MKKIFVYIGLLLPSLAFAQSTPGTFNIQGKLGSLNPPARAYLFYQLGANKIVDSAAIIEGSFAFKGEVMDPGQAFLIIDHSGTGSGKFDNTSDVLSFYVEKATINVTSSTDSVAKAQITGSPVNDDNKKLMALLQPVNIKSKQLYDESQAATPAQQQSADFNNQLQARSQALQAEQKAVLTTFIKNNPSSYLSLLALNSLSPSPDPAEIEPLYNTLDQKLKDTEYGKLIKKSIDALKPTEIGAIAPDFTQSDVNGNPVALSSFRGKYVLIDFWASWCGPCRQENPNLVAAYNRYKGKNFTILGVSLDKASGKTDWLNAIKNDGLIWTQVSDLNFWNNQAAVLYAVQSIPHNFLIDPTGKIIAKDLRGSDLTDKLAQIFGKM
jgi:peroxiredoxin